MPRFSPIVKPEYRSEVTPHCDEKTIDALNELVNFYKDDFSAEYQIYTLYKTKQNLIYCLIYGFCKTPNKSEKTIEKTINIFHNEVNLLQTKIKAQKIPVDYLFVMPYIDVHKDGKIIDSGILEPIVTLQESA